MKLHGNDPPKSRALETTKQSGDVAATTTAQAGAAESVAPVEQRENEAGGAGAKQALRALAIDVRSPAQEEESKGAEAATFGAKLMSFVRSKGFKKGATVAALGISLLGTAQQARADTVFLDFNNGVKEVEAARQLAREKGEPFVLVRPTKEALDELFAKAERGEVDLRHLILSGHSGGTSIWGSSADGQSHNASIDDFRQLKQKYPKAFEQIEHVNFMACYAGGEGNSAQWAEVFNNARAIVGFYGSGPASDRPASSWVLKNVERELRRLPNRTLTPQEALIKARQIANLDGPKHTKFGIRLDGVHYQAGKTTSNAELTLQRVQFNRNQVFQPFFTASPGHENPPANHQVSPLRDYYNQLQDAVNHLPAGSEQATQVQGEIRTTIRLIYFDNILKNAQLHQGSTFGDANAQLRSMNAGFEIPSDLRGLSRRQVLDLNDKLQGLGNADLATFLSSQASTAAQVNDFFSSRGIDYRFEMPNAAEDSWRVSSAIEDLEHRLASTTFSQEDKDFVATLQQELKAVREMPSQAREQAAIDEASQFAAGLKGSLSWVLQDTQSAARLPNNLEEAQRLGLDGLRQLSQTLKTEARGLDEWKARHLNEAAGRIDALVGTGGAYTEAMAVTRVLSHHESQISSLNSKLQENGVSARIGAGDKLKGTGESLDPVLRDMNGVRWPSQAVLDAVKALREGIQSPPETVVGKVARFFNDALKELKPSAVPDNWITD